MTWPRVQVRRVAKLGTGHTPSRQHPEYWEDCTIPWLTLADVWQLRDGTRQVVTDTAEQVSELGLRNSAAVLHAAGTVALSRTASVGFSCILGRDMATSQDFATWTCGPKLLPKFLLWALRGTLDDIRAATMGSTHKTIYMPDIEQIRVPLPPVEAQRAVADCLDAETARIDGLIETKRRISDLLEERRVAVTAAAVTNPVWPRVKLTLVAQLGSGHTPSRDRPDWWENPTIPWVTTGDVGQMRGDRIEFIEDTKLAISELGLGNSAAELHPAGTVVLSRTASVGFSAIMARPMATSQDFATWTCGPRLRPRFLLLCLRAMRSELLGRLAMGSTHKTIYMPDIEAIRVSLPTVEEQERIVTEAWERLRPIDTAVTAIDRQIDLLREHRQALITAAVTGQLEVAKTRS